MSREQQTGHARTCPAYGNYQPPYEECNCGWEPIPPTTPQLNKLRLIIRTAMNDVKTQEYSTDYAVSRTASSIWGKLDGIFKELGPFVEEDNKT